MLLHDSIADGTSLQCCYMIVLLMVLVFNAVTCAFSGVHCMIVIKQDRRWKSSTLHSLLRFISSGRFAGQLTSGDLGTSIHEIILPEVHFLLLDICRCLNIEICPELIEMEELQGDSVPGQGRGGAKASNQSVGALPPYLLLQLPHSLTPVAEIEPQLTTSGLRHGSSSSQPVSPDQIRVGGGGPQLGWRRRALVLLKPGLLASSPPLEAKALLAMALAPMALPGGGGWKLSLLGHSSSNTSSSPERRNVTKQATATEQVEGNEGGRNQSPPRPMWTPPTSAAGEAAAAAAAAAQEASWPAVADVATAATLGVVRAEAMSAQLPLELQVQTWLQQDEDEGCDRQDSLVD
jgi:hypothetical protein